MPSVIDHHTALIYTMVLVAAAEGEMTDSELGTIGQIVRFLPVFRDFDSDRLIEVGSGCAELLKHEDGLDQACALIREALSPALRETAYALACDVAAADGAVQIEEINLLILLRERLGIERLVAAAIERTTRARHATP